MPPHRTQIAHTLGRAGALARLRAFTEWARGNSDLKGTWEGNTFTFSTSMQGARCWGTMRVEEGCIELDSEVSPPAPRFAGLVPEMIRMALNPPGPGSVAAAQPRPAPVARPVPKPESDRPTVLFLHIPKAGGHTLGDYIGHQYGVGSMEGTSMFHQGILSLPYGFFKDADLGLPASTRPYLQRPDLRVVSGHFSFGVHRYVARPSTYITVLREPVDRVVSIYYYLELQKQMTLEEFVASPPFREIDNDQTRRIAGVDPEIGTLTRAALETAKENLRRHFSVMGTLERFEETLVLLNRRLGWTREAPSKPQNVTKKRKDVTAIPGSTLEAIRGWNELDVELYRFVAEWMDRAIEEEGPAFHQELARRRARGNLVHG